MLAKDDSDGWMASCGRDEKQNGMAGPVEFPRGTPIQLAKPQWNSPSDVRKTEFHGVKMIRMVGPVEFPRGNPS